MIDTTEEMFKSKQRELDLLKELAKRDDELKVLLDKEKSNISIIPEVIKTEKFRIPEDYYKIPEKSHWWKFWSQDKTNPITMIIFSPAKDVTIRERVVDQKGNLTLGKKTVYRCEPKELWDIADSDISGFKGKKIHFYWQDIADPIGITRGDDLDVNLMVNTENYSKSTKMNLVRQLLEEEMTFKDYMLLIIGGANIVLSLGIILKVWLLDGKGGG